MSLFVFIRLNKLIKSICVIQYYEFVKVSMENGNLVFEVKPRNLNLLKIKSDRSVSDGIGHNVLLQIDQQYVSMFIDDKKSAQMATNFDSGNKV